MVVRSRVQPVGLPKKTLGHEIAEQLREEIVTGRLAPGADVAEIPTAERLGVSRVPVREAMLVLERDGLLVFDQRGRCQVTSLSPRDFQEIYDVRLMLECESFKLAAERHTAQHLALLERNIAQLERAKSQARITLLDIEFHSLIVDAAQQTRLSRLWDIMRGQVQLFTSSLQRQVYGLTLHLRDTSVAAHRGCLAVIASRDTAAAQDSAREHLQPWHACLLQNRQPGGPACAE